MADYRRLISYIYEYEGKKEREKCGICEAGGAERAVQDQCQCEADLYGRQCHWRVSFRTGGRETFLGNVFVRGGNGEFRVNVDAKNVEGSGTGLDTYFGLSVHDVKNSWRCYKTIWEDALAAEEGNTGENPVLSVPEIYCPDAAGGGKRNGYTGGFKGGKRDRGGDRQGRRAERAGGKERI